MPMNGIPTPVFMELERLMWPKQKERSAMEVYFDVTRALLVREYTTRFGDRKFGYLWLLLEPLGIIAVISLMFSVRGREGLGLAELPVFIATGLVPLFMFRKGVARGMKGASSNKGLFTFPLVKPFATITTRVLVEVIICLLMLVVLTGFFQWMSYRAMPVELWGIFAALLLLAILSLGFALLLSALYELVPSVSTVWSLLSMPLMILSGAVVPILKMVPPQYVEYLLLNPILHALELIRFYWLDAYPLQINLTDSWIYLYLWTQTVLFFGLAAYRLTWRRMVSS